MQAIIAIPLVVCIVALFRRPLSQVFLWVYLPVMLLLPTFYFYKLPNLPPVSASEVVLLPLGLVTAWKLLPRWRLTTTDFWVALFIVSSAVFHFQTNDGTIGWFNLFHNVCQALVPYLFGKVLIEQSDLRVATVRQIAVLVAMCCVPSWFEYLRGRNLFVLLFARFFPDEPTIWTTQIRWGFGRVAGPYGQSELAGIVLLVALVFAVWAGTAYPWAKKFRGVQHPLSQRTILLGVLGVTLFTTQARGPWLGCVVALPVALLGRTRHLLRNALLLMLCCALAGAVVYERGARYTKTDAHAESDEQQTAQYRRQLLEAYVPEAQAGGAWGLGENFPVQKSADSIDNEFLFLWLVQGWVGLASFVFIIVETMVRLMAAIARSTGKRDRFFALTLLAAFLGMLVTIGTVFLSQQPYQMFFLLAGWAQSVRTVAVREEERRLSFAHVLT